MVVESRSIDRFVFPEALFDEPSLPSPISFDVEQESAIDRLPEGPCVLRMSRFHIHQDGLVHHVELGGLGTDTEIIEDGVTVLIPELGRRAFLAEGGLDSFEVLVGFGGRRRVTTLQRTQQLADKILILHSLRALLLDIYMKSLFEELLKRNGLLIPGWSGFPSYP